MNRSLFATALLTLALTACGQKEAAVAAAEAAPATTPAAAEATAPESATPQREADLKLR